MATIHGVLERSTAARSLRSQAICAALHSAVQRSTPLYPLSESALSPVPTRYQHQTACRETCKRESVFRYTKCTSPKSTEKNRELREGTVA